MGFVERVERDDIADARDGQQHSEMFWIMVQRLFLDAFFEFGNERVESVGDIEVGFDVHSHIRFAE